MENLEIKDYVQGIMKLIELAQGDTGGSRVAAQVLLSAYNGEGFQLNIVDLCNLDHNYYAATLKVIIGRVKHRIEPQTLVENGNSIFEGLWKQWEKLHVQYRGLPYCELCHGNGLILIDPSGEKNDEKKECTLCSGRGFVK